MAFTLGNIPNVPIRAWFNVDRWVSQVHTVLLSITTYITLYLS